MNHKILLLLYFSRVALTVGAKSTVLFCAKASAIRTERFAFKTGLWWAGMARAVQSARSIA